MSVVQAEFIISAAGEAQYPADGLPEIALSGRSNVGKSSLINRLIHRKNLARTSSQPGKTQTLNYYRIDEAFYFVDLPGYGYAKVSKTMRQQWGQMIEHYLLHREPLRLVLHIIDVRHPPTKDDQLMYAWLGHHGIPRKVIATKADKIGKNKWPKHVKAIRTGLEMGSGEQPLLFSAETGLGQEELWEKIHAAVSPPSGF